MEGISRACGRLVGGMGIAVAGFLAVGCADFEESGLPGSAASMARNQMMLVREDPPSFGYDRLKSLSRIYPDLAFFIKQRGAPDFLAETDAASRDYFILYYLKARHAFACRTGQEAGQGIEFAGPYPITDKEYRILSGFREKAER